MTPVLHALTHTPNFTADLECPIPKCGVLPSFTLFVPTDIRVTSLVCTEDVAWSAIVVLEYAEFYSSD